MLSISLLYYWWFLRHPSLCLVSGEVGWPTPFVRLDQHFYLYWSMRVYFTNCHPVQYQSFAKEITLKHQGFGNLWEPDFFFLWSCDLLIPVLLPFCLEKKKIHSQISTHVFPSIFSECISFLGVVYIQWYVKNTIVFGLDMCQLFRKTEIRCPGRRSCKAFGCHWLLPRVKNPGRGSKVTSVTWHRAAEH